MDYSKWGPLALLLSMLTVTAPSEASPVPGDLFTSDTCPSNCVSTMRSVNSLLVVARNAEGAVFSTVSFRMPRNAVLVSAPGTAAGAGRPGLATPASATSTGGQCFNQPGLCTETAVRTYSTPTHYIFYTYTYIYRDGNLVHIEVEESRILRDQVQ